MKNNVLIAIIIGVVIIISAGIIAYGMMNASPKEVKIIENKSIANNSSIGNNSSVAHNDSIKVESVNQGESSSSDNVHKSGLSDSEIDANIERDLAVRKANGVKSEYNMEEARSFYENVPKEGMI